MNLSPATVHALASDGIDIVRVSTLLPVNASDEEILDLARREGQTDITQDADFSALPVLGGYDRPSLIMLRLLDTAPDLVTRRLREVLPSIEAALCKGSAITIDDKNVRVRESPIRWSVVGYQAI
jgi:predicted nuclease of predicted toxin-antitoxin system